MTGLLRHLVLFRFKPGADAADVDALVAAFRALPSRIDRVADFECGTDVSPEGLSQGYTHAFVLGFADAAGRDAYLVHPAHQAFVAQAQPLLEQALVVDYVAAGPSPAVA